MAQLLSNLPVGAKVKFGKHSINGEAAQDITWLIVAKNHANYVSNSVTLLTEGVIDIRPFDAPEDNPKSSDPTRRGNSDYSLSNINQWLNSENVSWYTPTHAYDEPPTNTNISNGTGYVDRPGFLYNFSTDERNAILTNTINAVANGVIISVATRVYLPSYKELGITISEMNFPDTPWSYFGINGIPVAKATGQCVAYTVSSPKPSSSYPYWSYWTRTPRNLTPSNILVAVGTSGQDTGGNADYGGFGIRPVLNLSQTLSVSDTADSDGCYTFLWNAPPSSPSVINVPTIYGGKSNLISWSTAPDPDGDVPTYQLECSINGGGYTQIYNGSTITYAHLVPFGTSTVSYRVKATDPLGESSAYTTSATVTVINNNAPMISGSDTNLGVKTDDFTGTYTITDANSDIVTVTEAIDGVQIRALVATLGETITYGVKGNTWLALANGSHTLTISATDGIDTTVRTIVFTKLADKFSIQNSTPWASSTMPSRIMVVVTRNVPSTSKFKVEVCNNGYDASPTWEDATDAVTSGLVHVFSNTKKTASNWGVLVRVTVERNGATGACYVSAIGGNFE